MFFFLFSKVKPQIFYFSEKPQGNFSLKCFSFVTTDVIIKNLKIKEDIWSSQTALAEMEFMWSSIYGLCDLTIALKSCSESLLELIIIFKKSTGQLVSNTASFTHQTLSLLTFCRLTSVILRPPDCSHSLFST